MKALILDAGFGTRLREDLDSYSGPHQEFVRGSIEKKPKGLVPVKLRAYERKPIASLQVQQLLNAGIQLSDIYVQTNAIFYGDYLAWARDEGIPIENVFNNGVLDYEDRNEQAFDMISAIRRIGIDLPLFLFASDTLVFDEQDEVYDLSLVLESWAKNEDSHLVVYYKPEKAYNHGVVSVDEDSADNYPPITNFRETPAGVESGLVNASVYFLTVEKLREVLSYTGEWIKGRKGNVFESAKQGFRAVQATRRLDMGTLDDFLKENGL